MSERNLLLEPDKQTYRTRWWILLVSFAHFAHQNFGLNTWGPIAQSAKAVFGWEDTTIAFILNMGRAGSVVYLCIGCYLLDKYGLRITMSIYAVVMLLSNGLRSLSEDRNLAFWLITVAEFLNGSNGVITFAAPPMIAATWFPAGERITAVALMVLAAYVGEGLSSILGPVMITKPHFNSSVSNTSCLDNCTMGPEVTTVINEKEILKEIMTFLYIQTGVSVVLLVATLVYYPNRPASAPSTTAAMERHNYRETLRGLIRNKKLMVLIVVFGVLVGVFLQWVCVLNIVFDPLGVTQISAGWIGFYTVLTGSIMGFVIARLLDKFMKRIKPVLISMFIVITTMSFWTAIIASGMIPFYTWQLYVSSIAGGAVFNASFPLWYELLCEMSFPLPEGAINGISDFVFLVFANGFYALMYIPAPDYRWLTWSVFVCSVLGLVTIVLLPVTYVRTDIDTGSCNQEQQLRDITMETSQQTENYDGSR